MPKSQTLEVKILQRVYIIREVTWDAQPIVAVCDKDHWKETLQKLREEHDFTQYEVLIYTLNTDWPTETKSYLDPYYYENRRNQTDERREGSETADSERTGGLEHRRNETAGDD